MNKLNYIKIPIKIQKNTKTSKSLNLEKIFAPMRLVEE